ncbi:MAG TPA: carboxypeptidase-like regulatory domain-containing protein, partial [Kofleriaceae bacterium]|nr:carboxypeptidase-like regulatory domain-containing protein [Kofleriaceae bacterium]
AERKMAQLTMEPMLLGGDLTATANANGDFELRDVPLGPWNLRALGADGTRGKAAVEAIAGGLNDVVIKLEPGASIAGRVIDQDGKGIAGATVMAGPTQGAVNHTIRNGVVTSGQQVLADGTSAFVLRGLEPNAYQLSALARGRPVEFVGAPPKPVKVEQGAAVTGIELKVKRPNGVIRGVVLGPNGAPMAEAWVSARLNVAAMMSQIAGPPRGPGPGPAPGPRPAPPANGSNDPGQGDTERSEMIEISDDSDDGIAPVLTDAAGKFELRGLPAGQYDLIAEAQAGKLRGRGSSATAGNPVTIKLTGLTELRGVVTANGKPVSSYSVRIEGPMESSMDITNASGEYRFIRVDPGTYRVSVTGDAGRGSGEVNVVEGATASLDIKLTSDGVVVGKLVDTAGKPVANAPVLVVAWQPPNTPQQITLNGPPPMSNADGTFKVSAPAGKSTLLALGGGRTMYSGFMVVSGQTLDVGSIVQGTTTEAK